MTDWDLAPRAGARVGVLSLQGDYALHSRALLVHGVEPVRVSQPDHLRDLEALVMPGGESSTMLRLLESTGLRAPLERFVREKPVLGTCAGVILLSTECERLPHPPLGALDVTVVRNAYGRQIASFSDRVDAPVLGAPFDGVFIRAPRIRRIGPGVEVIATHAGETVGVRQGRIVGLTFHPELTPDPRFHLWFLATVAGLAADPAAVRGMA